jgi:hypothetical protein
VKENSSFQPKEKRMRKPTKPIEPDLEIARKEYEEKNQLDFIYKMEILRDYTISSVERILKDLKKFVDSLGQSKKVVSHLPFFKI